MIRYASVCDGISAASVAWKPLGWDCAWVSEIDPFACAVLAERWPDHHNVGDMLAINERILDRGPIDLLVGGTPCQSFSVAGLRGGLDDARGNLALRFCQLAGLLRPKWIVWENVPGVLSSTSGQPDSTTPDRLGVGHGEQVVDQAEYEEVGDFSSIVTAFLELGYGVAYRILDAQFFGVPQRRRRVFVVGCAGDWRRSAAVLFDAESLRGNSSTGRKARKDTAGKSSSSVGVSGSGVVAGTLGANHGNIKAEHAWTNQLVTVGPLMANSHPGSYSGKDAHSGHLIAFSSKNDGSDVSDISPTLRAMNHSGSHANAGGQVAVAFAFAQNSRDEVRKIGGDGQTVGALSAQPGMKQQSFLCERSAVRRLTPRECERLQGFPDEYTLVTYRKKPAADGPRYKAIGNSMAVPVMRWIGERIAFVESIS